MTDIGSVSLAPATVTVGGDARSVSFLSFPEAPAESRPRAIIAGVFVASLALHVGLATRMHDRDPAAHVAPKKSQVEIQMTRPPPPPKPVVVPPQVDHPPPPRPAAAPRPQPHLAAPPPVQAPVAAEGEAVAPPPAPTPPAPAVEGTGEAPVVVAAPAPPPPPPAPVVQAKEGANYLKNPRPPYPSMAQREGWEGTVLLKVQVLPNGKTASVAVQRTSGHAVLDSAAIAAVTGWSFQPATQGGAPVAGWVTVPVDFRLQ
jgi:protein TonB